MKSISEVSEGKKMCVWLSVKMLNESLNKQKHKAYV